MKVKSVYAWTWLRDEGDLCQFAEAQRKFLLEHPMVDARAVRVKMVYAPIKRIKKIIHKLSPSDYEYCPHCRGSFSFAPLGKNYKCKWCHKDVRTSKKMA